MTGKLILECVDHVEEKGSLNGREDTSILQKVLRCLSRDLRLQACSRGKGLICDSAI